MTARGRKTIADEEELVIEKYLKTEYVGSGKSFGEAAKILSKRLNRVFQASQLLYRVERYKVAEFGITFQGYTEWVEPVQQEGHTMYELYAEVMKLKTWLNENFDAKL